MSKPVFPDVVAQAKARWLARWAPVRPLAKAIGRFRAPNTFDAGTSNRFQRRVLIHLQAGSRPGEVGTFTVNLVVLRADGPLSRINPGNPARFADGVEGSYRLGLLLYGHDKWWSVRPGAAGPGGVQTWRPAEGTVGAQAVSAALEAVEVDIEEALRRINHHLGADGRITTR